MKKLRKILRNKKGEDMLVDFWAILLFVLILILFLVLFIFTKGDSRSNELRGRLVNTDLNYMMNSYLKSPSLFDGTKTNGEIIAEDFLNNDYKRTENSFKAFFTGVETINADMKDNQMRQYTISSIKLCVYDSSDSFQAGYELDMRTKSITNLMVYCGVPMSIANAKTIIPTRDSFLYVETVMFGDVMHK